MFNLTNSQEIALGRICNRHLSEACITILGDNNFAKITFWMSARVYREIRMHGNGKIASDRIDTIN